MPYNADMYNPYGAPPPFAPPPYVEERPAVWPWYIAYAVMMALLYFCCVGLGAFLLTMGDSEALIQGIIFAGISFPLMIVFGVAPFLPKKPWAWTFHLVLICLSMTSGCCMPISIPLLIYWLKPETKAFFQKY